MRTPPSFFALTFYNGIRLTDPNSDGAQNFEIFGNSFDYQWPTVGICIRLNYCGCFCWISSILAKRLTWNSVSKLKLEFHGTDNDTDILADFLARILARLSVRDARVYICTRVLQNYTIGA